MWGEKEIPSQLSEPMAFSTQRNTSSQQNKNTSFNSSLNQSLVQEIMEPVNDDEYLLLGGRDLPEWRTRAWTCCDPKEKLLHIKNITEEVARGRLSTVSDANLLEAVLEEPVNENLPYRYRCGFAGLRHTRASGELLLDRIDEWNAEEKALNVRRIVGCIGRFVDREPDFQKHIQKIEQGIYTEADDFGSNMNNTFMSQNMTFTSQTSFCSEIDDDELYSEPAPKKSKPGRKGKGKVGEQDDDEYSFCGVRESRKFINAVAGEEVETEGVGKKKGRQTGSKNKKASVGGGETVEKKTRKPRKKKGDEQEDLDKTVIDDIIDGSAPAVKRPKVPQFVRKPKQHKPADDSVLFSQPLEEVASQSAGIFDEDGEEHAADAVEKPAGKAAERTPIVSAQPKAPRKIHPQDKSATSTPTVSNERGKAVDADNDGERRIRPSFARKKK